MNRDKLLSYYQIIQNLLLFIKIRDYHLMALMQTLLT